VLLFVPRYRRNERLLAVACGMVFLSLWIDKGIGLIVAAFVPSPLGAVTEYGPTLPGAAISLGIWAVGALILTILYRIALAVRSGSLLESNEKDDRGLAGGLARPVPLRFVARDLIRS
jgi:Ni/Fe-hydrogenase subunit HybB-like protein